MLFLDSGNITRSSFYYAKRGDQNYPVKDESWYSVKLCLYKCCILFSFELDNPLACRRLRRLNGNQHRRPTLTTQQNILDTSLTRVSFSSSFIFRVFPTLYFNLLQINFKHHKSHRYTRITS